jgi:S-adenosylmethionine hydrolase
LGNQLSVQQIPDVPSDRIAWVDGYGNLKTTIPADSVKLKPESKVVVRVGDIVSDAVYSDGSFRVPEGTLAFAPGSSGWMWQEGKSSVRWMELFLRGGSAWHRFGKPHVNGVVTYQLI